MSKQHMIILCEFELIKMAGLNQDGRGVGRSISYDVVMEKRNSLNSYEWSAILY